VKPDSPDGKRFQEILTVVARMMEGTGLYGFVIIGLTEDGQVVASNANCQHAVAETLADALRVALDKDSHETVIEIDRSTH